jgi:NAD(P)-dependent dehydrogenase (short-subunit alcohol dehydrogenase family)
VTELTERTTVMRLDGLVNNAMTGFSKKHFHKISSEELAASFQKNVLPVVRLTQAAIEGFKKKRSGKIVTILTSALVGKPPIGWSEYVANKAYLLAMSKCWATEYSKFNVTANCVSPSFMLTDLNADTDERMVEELIKNSPQQRLLEPEEVAQAVHFLLHGSQQMNGVNLVINQGMGFA